MERYKETVFVRSNRMYDVVKPWVDNAAEQHAKAPFKTVISTEARPGFVHIDDVDPTSFPGSRDTSVTGSIENIMNAIRPLLNVSGSLYLVDPYFQPWAARTRELLSAVLTARKQGAEFKAFVSSKEWPELEYADKKIREALPRLSSHNGNFKVAVCNDEESTARMHARYLFSEKGGVRLDKGLQTDEGMIDLSFIDKDVHGDLLRKFVERTDSYKVIREYSY